MPSIPRTARFHNFLSSDRRWLDEQGSEDCSWPGDLGVGHSGGALAALEFADDGRTTLRAGTAGRDGVHFAAGLGIQPDWHSRVFGPAERATRLAIDVREELTGRLMTIFDKVAGPGWTWFEEGLTYDNAKLAHALIVSGRATGPEERVRTRHRGFALAGGRTDFAAWATAAHWQQRILSAQRRTRGLRPAAHRGADHASRLAWKRTAPRPTCGGTNRRNAPSTGSWVGTTSGRNSTARQTGGCRDGLHVDRSNENQGAESMLAFLMSLTEMRLTRNVSHGAQRAGLTASMTG